MDEIPDDIEKAAAGVVASLGIGGSSNPNPDGFTIRDAIARALLAEREAATKAEREYIADFVEAKMSDVDPEYGTFIATAIRSGARP